MARAAADPVEKCAEKYATNARNPAENARGK